MRVRGDERYRAVSATLALAVAGALGLSASALARAHCALGRQTRRRSRKFAKGRVISQSPAAGKCLGNGAKVAVVVSNGAPKAAAKRH